MIKKTFVYLVICALAVQMSAQVQVYPLGNLPEKVKYTGSVTYALPTTTLKVTVSVSKVREVRGYFADYAESLLGLTNIIKQNQTRYALNSVKVEPLRTPDLTNVYRAYTTNAAVADAWDAGRKSSTVFLPDTGLNVYQTHTASLPEFFKNYADISYTQQSEAFVDTKIIDGVVTQVPASHTKTVSKSFDSKAREAADAIMKSRKDQYALVAGEQETPYSGEALQTMLAELKNWESNYMSLFTGVTVADTIEYVLYLTPSDNLNEPMTAFYLSPEKGFDTGKGAATNAYQLSFKRMYQHPIEKVSLQYPTSSYLTRTEMPVRISLNQNGRSLHDFGIINVYQAGATVFSSAKQPVDVNSIGFVFE